MQTDVAVPLHNFGFMQSRLLFAPDERAGSKQIAKSDRVLIIEDDQLVANQIDGALTDAGFEVIGAAASGEEAMELARSRSPVLAVVDIRLAGDMDGVDTAIALFRSHGIRCVFASAYSDDEAHRRAAAAAPLGWVQKPYTMRSLVATVRAAVKELRSKKS
jgi:two-component system, response regulator PdtaR